MKIIDVKNKKDFKEYIHDYGTHVIHIIGESYTIRKVSMDWDLWFWSMESLHPEYIFHIQCVGECVPVDAPKSSRNFPDRCYQQHKPVSNPDQSDVEAIQLLSSSRNHKIGRCE